LGREQGDTAEIDEHLVFAGDAGLKKTVAMKIANGDEIAGPAGGFGFGGEGDTGRAAARLDLDDFAALDIERRLELAQMDLSASGDIAQSDAAFDLIGSGGEIVRPWKRIIRLDADLRGSNRDSAADHLGGDQARNTGRDARASPDGKPLAPVVNDVSTPDHGSGGAGQGRSAEVLAAKLDAAARSRVLADLDNFDVQIGKRKRGLHGFQNVGTIGKVHRPLEA